jgi:hypothetical protein
MALVVLPSFPKPALFQIEVEKRACLHGIRSGAGKVVNTTFV